MLLFTSCTQRRHFDTTSNNMLLLQVSTQRRHFDTVLLLQVSTQRRHFDTVLLLQVRTQKFRKYYYWQRWQDLQGRYKTVLRQLQGHVIRSAHSSGQNWPHGRAVWRPKGQSVPESEVWSQSLILETSLSGTLSPNWQNWLRHWIWMGTPYLRASVNRRC